MCQDKSLTDVAEIASTEAIYSYKLEVTYFLKILIMPRAEPGFASPWWMFLKHLCYCTSAMYHSATSEKNQTILKDSYTYFQKILDLSRHFEIASQIN